MQVGKTLGSLIIATLIGCLVLPAIVDAKTIYVNKKGGKNSYPGTKDKPFKNLDKAIKKAEAGDTLLVAEGVYKGTFNIGYWEIDKSLHLYGGYSKDFSTRDVIKHATVLQPGEDRFEKSGSQWMMLTKDGYKYDGVTVDGFVFEQGLMNPFNKGGQLEGVETGIMKVGPGSRNPNALALGLWGNNLVVKNNIFVNCSMGGVLIKLGMGGIPQLNGKGRAEVANNVFVNVRMNSIEAFGTDGAPAGQVDIHHNTILFTWSRLKDFGDNGYGIEVRKKLTFKIHDNIIACNIGPGINSQYFNTDLYIDRNLFFGNKMKDFWFNPASNTSIKLTADQFEDLELPSVEDNVNEQIKLPVNQAYLAGFLSARYSEKVDFDPDSPMNQMRALFGLNQQGKIHSKVTMFANRYPWKETFALFGAHPDKGAQKPTGGPGAESSGGGANQSVEFAGTIGEATSDGPNVTVGGSQMGWREFGKMISAHKNRTFKFEIK